MCQAVDEVLQECKTKVIDKEGKTPIANLNEKLNRNQEEAMDLLDIPLGERKNDKLVSNLYVIHFLYY